MVARAMGIEDMKLVNLMHSGCSIRKHYFHAVNNLAEYRYDLHTGPDWPRLDMTTIAKAVAEDQWDWISIQHGSKDGSFYSKQEDYSDLPALVEYVKARAWSGTKIAFNMTWTGEPELQKQEMLLYGSNQLVLYQKIADLTRELIVPMPGIDRVIPTGTAIQNARTANLGLLTRDKYHLTKDTGCYIAGLAFFRTLTGLDVSNIPWAPEETDSYAKQVALEAVANAIQTPFAVTACKQ